MKLSEIQKPHPLSAINHDRIMGLLNDTGNMFNGERLTTDYLQKELANFADIAASTVPGYVATFATGYPFYAIDQEGHPIKIKEIDDFIATTKDLVASDKEKNGHGWPCPACQRHNVLPDLKTHCNPCSEVRLKPRDVFRALPDLDAWVVVEKNNAGVEQVVRQVAASNRYLQSDRDMQSALDRTEQAFENIEHGNTSGEERVPLDLHLVTTETVSQCVDKVVQGEKVININARSLHMDWEVDSYNFLFDLIFSLTIIHEMNNSLSQEFSQARKAIKQAHTEQQILQLVATASKRGTRLLQTREVRQILKAKIASW